MQSPIVKSTPAMKRLRSNDTPGSVEKANKRSRIEKSPNQSLNLQLSDSSEQPEDDSPVKKPTKKKVFIESDSEWKWLIIKEVLVMELGIYVVKVYSQFIGKLELFYF